MHVDNSNQLDVGIPVMCHLFRKALPVGRPIRTKPVQLLAGAENTIYYFFCNHAQVLQKYQISDLAVSNTNS